MTTQVITTSGTSAATTALNTTKARVTATQDAYWATGSTAPVAYAGNCEIIAAGQTRYINTGAVGNKIAFLQVTTAGNISVVEVGQ